MLMLDKARALDRMIYIASELPVPEPFARAPAAGDARTPQSAPDPPISRAATCAPDDAIPRAEVEPPFATVLPSPGSGAAR